ncbi:MAG: DUF86 domain-containing protein [Candidatus Atribacteria bacterium]|nr:DUF86 domain-containing protein [Candidatus Atribacteria bacterium]
MPDKDVILSKISRIQRCLRRIKEITNLNPENLDDLLIQDAFILNLQRAVQASIDIAVHIVASEALGLPTSLKDNFRLLFENNIIDENTFKKMQKMAGFRNIAVHDYQSLNIGILKSILTKNLKDLEDFYTIIVHKYDLTSNNI